MENVIFCRRDVSVFMFVWGASKNVPRRAEPDWLCRDKQNAGQHVYLAVGRPRNDGMANVVFGEF